MIKKFFKNIFKRIKNMFGFTAYDTNGKVSVKSDSFTSFVRDITIQNAYTTVVYSDINVENTWIALALLPSNFPNDRIFWVTMNYGLEFDRGKKTVKIHNNVNFPLQIAIGVF